MNLSGVPRTALTTFRRTDTSRNTAAREPPGSRVRRRRFAVWRSRVYCWRGHRREKRVAVEAYCSFRRRPIGSRERGGPRTPRGRVLTAYHGNGGDGPVTSRGAARYVMWRQTIEEIVRGVWRRTMTGEPAGLPDPRVGLHADAEGRHAAARPPAVSDSCGRFQMIFTSSREGYRPPAPRPALPADQLQSFSFDLPSPTPAPIKSSDIPPLSGSTAVDERDGPTNKL